MKKAHSSHSWIRPSGRHGKLLTVCFKCRTLKYDGRTRKLTVKAVAPCEFASETMGSVIRKNREAKTNA